MSCYLPMIEKLKSAATGKNRSSEIAESKSKQKSLKKPKSIENEDNNYNSRFSHHNEGYDSEPPPYDSIHVDEPYTEPVIPGRRRSGGPLPRRDQAGFTITHDIGEFPNRVPLHIRYDHPRLALSDVAFQRQHQLHHHDVQRHQQQQQQMNQISVQHHQQQNTSTPLPRQQHMQQQYHSVLGSPMNSRGVLSLGLPPQLMPNSIFRRTPKPTAITTTPSPGTSSTVTRPPPSASSDVIHHTYETLNSRRFYYNVQQQQQQERYRQPRRTNQELYSNNNIVKSSNNNLTMLPPAQIRTRSQHPRGSSLPRKAKKIPSSSYNQILTMRPKSVQGDLILNYNEEEHPEPYCVTKLDLDSSLKTTDSGQTSGCSSGSSTVGSQSPKSHVDSDIIIVDSDVANVDVHSTLPPRRQFAFTSLPNRGPPPRHLVPTTLRPSPGVKLHPTDIIMSLRDHQKQEKGKQANEYENQNIRSKQEKGRRRWIWLKSC